MASRTVTWAPVFALWGLAVWLRLGAIPEASALGDAIHPWWAAIRDGWPRPHAAPYGWGLVLPYWVCLQGAPDLWTAVQRLAVVHALAAPLAAWVAWRVSGRRLAAVLIGLIVATDPGLMDTFRSGAETYLAPMWIGVVMLGTASRSRIGAPIALLAWAMALMHHPLSIAATPLLLGLRWRDRETWLGAGLAVVCLWPRLLRLVAEPLPGGAAQGEPVEALWAYLTQGGALAAVILLGPIIGLVSPRTRAVAIRCIASFALMAAIGVLGGYLRDHHLRLLTIPALMGWAAVPWPGLGLILGALAAPGIVQLPPSVSDRPGTLELVRSLTDKIVERVAPPAVVDAAWLSGGPAAAPAALMLDLHLRGWSAEDLSTGGTVVLVVSGKPDEVPLRVPPEARLVTTQQYALLQGQASAIEDWSRDWCGMRLGGAWDALSALHPGLRVEDTQAWWACR